MRTFRDVAIDWNCFSHRRRRHARLPTPIVLNLVEDVVLCVHFLPWRRDELEGQIGEGNLLAQYLRALYPA